VILRVILGITGASGVVYGVRLLEVLRERDVEVHLVISEMGRRLIELELERSYKDMIGLASSYWENNDLTAPIASGSFRTDGMIIAPCSMKTAASIANGISGNLITRAADVTLKERRKLIIIPREAPLSDIHLENLLKITRAGGIVIPASPAFYHLPERIEDLVDFIVGKALDVLGIEHKLYKEWQGQHHRR